MSAGESIARNLISFGLNRLIGGSDNIGIQIVGKMASNSITKC